MHIKSNRQRTIYQPELFKGHLVRHSEEDRVLHVANRRDFTTPRQHVKQMLKAAAQGFVWPTIA